MQQQPRRSRPLRRRWPHPQPRSLRPHWSNLQMRPIARRWPRPAPRRLPFGHCSPQPSPRLLPPARSHPLRTRRRAMRLSPLQRRWPTDFFALDSFALPTTRVHSSQRTRIESPADYNLERFHRSRGAWGPPCRTVQPNGVRMGTPGIPQHLDERRATAPGVGRAGVPLP